MARATKTVSVLLIVISCILHSAYGENEERLVSDSMYAYLPNAAACTRWLTNTGEIGCASMFLVVIPLLNLTLSLSAPKNAPTGSLALLNDQQSLEAFVKSPPTDKPMAVIPSLYWRPYVNSKSGP